MCIMQTCTNMFVDVVADMRAVPHAYTPSASRSCTGELSKNIWWCFPRSSGVASPFSGQFFLIVEASWGYTFSEKIAPASQWKFLWQVINHRLHFPQPIVTWRSTRYQSLFICSENAITCDPVSNQHFLSLGEECEHFQRRFRNWNSRSWWREDTK